MKTFAAAKASLVFIKNRSRSSRSQMVFKIGVLKNFALFTRKHQKACNFIKKRLQRKCFPVNIPKFLRAAFFNRTPPVAVSTDVLFYIIFSKRRCGIYCSCILYNCFILTPKITRVRFHLLCHSLPFVVLVIVTHCHLLSLVVALVVTHCTTRLSFHKRSCSGVTIVNLE